MLTETFNTDFGIYKIFSSCKEIGRAVRENRMFHPKISNWIDTHVSENTTFIDVGSNIGIYSVHIAKKYPSVNVISIEAHPQVYSLLSENVKLNNLSNVKTYNNCASNTNEGDTYMKPLVQQWKGNYGDNRIVKDGSLVVKPIRTDSVPVSSPVSVIKIDVQGFDYYALLGCESFIKEYHPTIILEWEPEMAIEHNHTIEDVSNFLTTYNYSVTERYNKDILFT